MAAAPKGLTPEAAHARHVLGVAGRGPESTRELVVDLMTMLVDQGYRNSVTWYMAPSPADDLRDIIFSIRSSEGEDPVPRRWHDRREIGAVLSDARRLASGSDAIEVWSGNGHGLQRLVLTGGNGRSLRFLSPESPQFAGEGLAVTAAVAAWSSWNTETTSPPTPSRQLAPYLQGPSSLTSKDAPVPAPIRALGTGDPDGAQPSDLEGGMGVPTVNPVLDADTLGAALQEALGEVRVEVELGSIEGLIFDSLRTALAELAPGATTLGPDEIDRANQRTVRQNEPAALTSGLERSLQDSISAAVEISLADQVPDLEEVVRRNIAAVDSTFQRIMPGLAEQIATATAGLLSTSPDPVDVARRVAASVLSPSEIAETMVFRLRPFLEEQGERLRHAESAEADRDRHALDLMRQRVEQLNERMDRRLKRLEDEVRRSQLPDGMVPQTNQASSVGSDDEGSGVPSRTDEGESPANSGLRVLRPQHGG